MLALSTAREELLCRRRDRQALRFRGKRAAGSQLINRSTLRKPYDSPQLPRSCRICWKSEAGDALAEKSPRPAGKSSRRDLSSFGSYSWLPRRSFHEEISHFRLARPDDRIVDLLEKVSIRDPGRHIRPFDHDVTLAPHPIGCGFARAPGYLPNAADQRSKDLVITMPPVFQDWQTVIDGPSLYPRRVQVDVRTA